MHALSRLEQSDKSSSGGISNAAQERFTSHVGVVDIRPVGDPGVLQSGAASRRWRGLCCSGLGVERGIAQATICIPTSRSAWGPIAQIISIVVDRRVRREVR